MKSLPIVLLAFSLYACQPSNPIVEKTPDPLVQFIDSLVLSQQEAFETPGIAVGLIRNGEIVYTNAVGVQNIETQDEMTVKSLFHMASVSKPFVATAIVQLVEAGKIELDKQLIDYLPYFKMADEDYKDITIRHMLTHTSGIHDVEDYEWENPQIDDGAAERYVKSFTEDELDFRPGTSYNYSNSAFDILADVIAKASGMTFEAYMKEHIFKPVGMKNSTFYQPEVPAEIATKPHLMGDDFQIKKWEYYPYNRIHAPSSTLHSNVEDMMRWALVNLNRGEINGNRIYSAESYDLLTKGQVKRYRQDSVGLSWFISDFEGKRRLAHSGGDTGYRTYFCFIPESQTALVMMTNSNVFSSDYLVQALLSDKHPAPWKQPIHLELKDLILTEGIEKVKAFYLEKQAQSPQSYLFDVGLLDDLGYLCIDRGYKQEALDLFLFMVELEPQHSGWPDSVADAYRAMDNKEKAIEWYQKALSLDPEQGFSQRKLKEMLE